MQARCPACGASVPLVHVHGHGQCTACGSNVEPCCAGAGAEADELGGPEIGVAPTLFAVLFDGLGGHSATVTESALLHALAARQGVGLDDARIVLEAGLHVGAVAPAGTACYRLPPAGQSTVRSAP
jgi:hypothetical protein